MQVNGPIVKPLNSSRVQRALGKTGDLQGAREQDPVSRKQALQPRHVVIVRKKRRTIGGSEVPA